MADTHVLSVMYLTNAQKKALCATVYICLHPKHHAEWSSTVLAAGQKHANADDILEFFFAYADGNMTYETHYQGLETAVVMYVFKFSPERKAALLAHLGVE
jgi:hypothetical protein